MRMVHFHARALQNRSHGLADLDELVAAGSVGLAQALSRTDPSAPTFRSYALRRVQGAMLDHLRQLDPLCRSERRNARKLRDAVERLRSKLGREPSAAEVVKESGLDHTEYEDARLNSERHHRVGIVNTLRPAEADTESVWLARDERPSAEDALEHHSNRRLLAKITESLDDRTRYVIESYYYERRVMSDIAAELGVSESRVSQMLKKGVDQLRELASTDSA
jgi:RNA polymerase sigma factor for flagellar operon FliA